MLQSLLESAGRDDRILAVILYGSRARGDARTDSDTDVSLVLRPGIEVRTTGLQVQLDYLKFHELEVRIYQRLPLHIRQRILKEGTVLQVKNEDDLYEIAFRTIRAFEDYRPFYLAYLEEVARG